MPDIYVSSDKEEEEKKDQTEVKQKKQEEKEVFKEKETTKKEPKPTKKKKEKVDKTEETIDADHYRVKKHVEEVIKSIGEKRSKKDAGAFAIWPENVFFETQEPKEEIVVLLRRHWITNVPWFLTTLLFVFAPLIMRRIGIVEFLPFRFKFILNVMWYLFVISFVFEKFLAWYFNVFIITDERIVDVDFISLVYKQVSESKIDRIQDMTFQMGGIVRSLFNFGTVYIQTAGEVPNIEFESVPKPQKVVKILNKLSLQEEKEKLEGRVR
jgi:membrane protein YdbS with pleckstrin-like domain